MSDNMWNFNDDDEEDKGDAPIIHSNSQKNPP
jgi:hypothetical protein